MYDVRSMFNYEIIGEIRHGGDNWRLSYNGTAANFFTTDYKMPFKIRTGRHAVIVKHIRPTGKVVRVDIAIIDHVFVYGYDPRTDILTLEFSATPVPSAAVSGEITDIPPQIVNILQNGNFLAILYRGDSTATVDYIHDNLRVFSHGGKLYKLYGANMIRDTLDPDSSIDVPRIETGVMVLACTDEIPDMEALYKFYCQFSRLIGIAAEPFEEFMRPE